MSSIIEGYSYDIFISYRQKDNKYDGWVTEFVDNLKKELEATFKEDISIYFDENPHDGLLETHSVDKSLEDKLKCLIFIPIISQTYCDPKSYAWQHEFCEFNKLAKEDKFGRDIKLNSGNVASRILPVKIHDLDPEDRILLENELAGVLRSIEFIYKSAGVNRPLTPTDNPDKNLNKTYYRDHINKVANAVKEIITALKKQSQYPEEVSIQDFKVKPASQKNLGTKIIVGSLILLAFIIVGLFIIPKPFKPSETLEKSVAVLPFVNLSNDPEQEYFSDGVVEAILNYLSKVGELKVISSTSTKRYRDTKLSIKEIARELGVASILEGSVQKIGNNVRITAQLIEAKTDVHLWSEIYDKDLSDIFSIQSEVAQNVAKELKATLTSIEKEQINKFQTQNTEAYNLYLQGRFYWNKRTKEGQTKSIEYFEKSLIEDSHYALAYAGMADAYYILAWYGWLTKSEGYSKAKEFALRALEIDKNLAEAHTTLGALFCWNEWNWEEARKELQLAIELNPNYANAHQCYSEYLDAIGQKEKARVHTNIALELDPFSQGMNIESALYYYNEGKFDESLETCNRLKELYPEYEAVNWRYFYIYLRKGEELNAVETLQKIKSGDKLIINEIYLKSGIDGILNWMIDLQLKNPDSYNLAKWNAILGKKDTALSWLEKAFEERSSQIPRVNSDIDLEPLRSEPRFKAMIMKLGL